MTLDENIIMCTYIYTLYLSANTHAYKNMFNAVYVDILAYIFGFQMRNIKEQIIPLNVEDSERENVAHIGSSSVQVSDEAHRAGYTASSEDGDMFIAVVKQPDYHYKVVAQEGEGEEALGNGHLDIQATQQQRTDLGRESKTVGITSGSGYLPISRKGPFDSDYFFENVRENYSQAVREVLEKAKEWSCRSDAMQNYRSLRQRNLRLDNQAVNISEDQHSHKVSLRCVLSHFICRRIHF